MCLILFAYEIHPTYRLMLVGNRDEFYDRPTSPLDRWTDRPDIFGGKDEKAGGTWLAVSSDGRWGAVTNYRDPASIQPDALSRGRLIVNYLAGSSSAYTFFDVTEHQKNRYNPYNLILGDRSTVYYGSNRSGSPRPLSPGIYGLSNHLLDTPWPKVVSARKRLSSWFEGRDKLDLETVFRLMQDDRPAPDSLLPDTGIGLEWERFLSPMFIRTPHYGTRSSSVLLLSRSGRIEVAEKGYESKGGEFVESGIRRFTVSNGG